MNIIKLSLRNSRLEFQEIAHLDKKNWVYFPLFIINGGYIFAIIKKLGGICKGIF
jgi:hypothetical protein